MTGPGRDLGGGDAGISPEVTAGRNRGITLGAAHEQTYAQVDEVHGTERLQRGVQPSEQSIYDQPAGFTRS